MQRTELASLYKATPADGTKVTVCGWAKTVRDSKNIGFISLSDGSCYKPVQIVFQADKLTNYAEIAKCGLYTSFEVTGSVVVTPGAKQPFEINADEITVLGPCNEALMELGALVCIPGTPHCEECPLADLCRGYAAGRADQLPVKPAPKAKGKVPVTVALIESEQGLLLQRRPARGLLAGLWQPAAWEKALTRDELTAALAGIGVQAALDEPLPPAKHVFTHKIWELGGWKGTAPACALPDGYVWAAPEDLAEVYPVPNAFGAYVKAK